MKDINSHNYCWLLQLARNPDVNNVLTNNNSVDTIDCNDSNLNTNDDNDNDIIAMMVIRGAVGEDDEDDDDDIFS